MWSYKEIKTEMDLGRVKPNLCLRELIKKCDDENAKPRQMWGSDGRFLGWAISDEDCERIFNLK